MIAALTTDGRLAAGFALWGCGSTLLLAVLALCTRGTRR